MRIDRIPEVDSKLLRIFPRFACAVFFLPSFFSFPILSGVYRADNWVLAFLILLYEHVIFHPFRQETLLPLTSSVEKGRFEVGGYSTYIGKFMNIQPLSPFSEWPPPPKAK